MFDVEIWQTADGAAGQTMRLIVWRSLELAFTGGYIRCRVRIAGRRFRCCILW